MWHLTSDDGVLLLMQPEWVAAICRWLDLRIPAPRDQGWVTYRLDGMVLDGCVFRPV